MNKKIILSLSVIGVVAAIAIGGTIAYFSDTETSVGNTFTAGTIDIGLDAKSGQAVETVSGDLDLKPSQTGWTTSVITNTGTNPAEIWKSISNVDNREHGIVDPERKYYNEYPGSENWLMSNWIHYDMLVTKPVELYSYSETIAEVVVNVTDDGEWLKWTYTYADIPTHTPKMTVAIDYSTGFAITTFDDGSHDGWYYAPDPDVVEATRVRLGDYDGYDGTEAGYEWVKTTASANVLTVSIKKSALNDTFKWHGYANYNGAQVWINDTETGTGYEVNQFEVTIRETILEILETAGFYLTPNQGADNGVESHWIYLGVLDPEESMTVKQSYHLDSSVDNWAQSDRVFFDVNFMAQQTTPLPEVPDSVLYGYSRI